MAEIMFAKFDTDKSGHMDEKEFQQLCFALGYALSPVEVTLALRVLDKDGSGHVDSKEFANWWKSGNRWEELKLDEKALIVRQKAADAFNEYDSQKTGVLMKESFDKFYQDIVNKNLSKKDKATFLSDLDSNGDGKIQFAEYIDWLQRQGTIEVKCKVDAAQLASVKLNKSTGPASPKPGAKAEAPKVDLKPAGQRDKSMPAVVPAKMPQLKSTGKKLT
jgi:hypothetical protein